MVLRHKGQYLNQRIECFQQQNRHKMNQKEESNTLQSSFTKQKPFSSNVSIDGKRPKPKEKESRKMRKMLHTSAVSQFSEFSKKMEKMDAVVKKYNMVRDKLKKEEIYFNPIFNKITRIIAHKK